MSDLKVIIRSMDDPPTPYYGNLWQVEAWSTHDLWAPVGLAWVGEYRERAQVQFLFTMPGHRRRGVASAMLAAIEARWPAGPVCMKPHTKAGRALVESRNRLLLEPVSAKGGE